MKTAEIILAESYHKQVSFFSSGFKADEYMRSDGREFRTEDAKQLKEQSPNVSVLYVL